MFCGTMAMGRQRDVFPLPHLCQSPLKDQCLSRGTKRRVQQRFAVTGQVNKAISALNSLYFGSDHNWNRRSIEDLNLLPLVQQDAIRHITGLIKQLGPPPIDACTQGAMNALRVAGSSYTEPAPDVGTVVNMKLGALSLPSGKIGSVSLVDHITGPVREMLGDFESHLLQDAALWSDIEGEASKIKTYNDPLLGSRAGYISFLKHLYQCGVLSFTNVCRGRVGAFCVSKKAKVVDGKTIDRQRLVLDCRSVSLQFRDPPRTELGSLASLSEIFIPDDNMLYMATSDICDCFYACDCPPGLEQFFCLEHDISPDEALDVTGGDFDLANHGDLRISPCFKVLPMGFNWSFYLVQVLHEQAALSALGQDRDTVFLDGHPSPVLQHRGCYSMPYCDNVHVLSLDPGVCQSGKDAVVAKLENMGFTLHEHTEASTITQTLGGILDGSTGQVRGTPRRMWSLILAFEHISNVVVSTELVQRLLGHAMCVCNFNRAGISIFRRLYDFVQSGCPPRKLSFSEARECRIFAGLVPLLVADLRRPWSPTITASDASPSGWGVCERVLNPGVAQLHGRWQERWRYRRLEPSEWKPRDRAFGLDILTDFGTVKGTSNEVDELDNYTNNESFPEIPHQLLEPSEWSTVSMGKWKFTKEHITLKEARSLLLAARRLSRAQRNRNKRHLVLLDNLALCFAVAKGRSSKFAILRVLQQLGAISLACAITIRPRWIPSEWNVADGPSRQQARPGPYCKESHSVNQKASDQQSPISFQPTSAEGCSSEPEGRGCGSNSSASSSNPCCQDSKDSSEGGGTFEQTVSSGHPSSDSARGCGQACSKEDVDCVGVQVHQQRSEIPVQPVLGTVRGLLQGERVPLATRVKRHRPPAFRLHGLSVHGRKGAPRRRENFSGSGIQAPLHEGQIGSRKKMFEGLEEGNASAKSPSNAKIGNVRCGNGVSCKGVSRYGLENHGRLPLVLETGRRTGPQGSKHHSSRPCCRQAIPVGDGGCERSGGSGPRQDWHLRQQFGNRSHHVGGSTAAHSEEEGQFKGRPDFHIHHGSLSNRICTSQQALEPRGSTSIPASTRRGIRGHGVQAEGVQCCEGTWKVALRHKRQKVHKDWESPGASQPTHSHSPSFLPVVGEKHGEDVPGDDRTKTAQYDVTKVDVFTMHDRPRRFCLEIFSGTSRIAAALQKEHITAFPIDIDLFPSHNVLDPKIAETICHWISSRRVRLIWLGMPCTTFSRARRNDGVGPLPLRDSLNIWGISGLRPHDVRKLHEGNKLFLFTMRILRLCEDLGIPYVLENPLTSMAWEMPPLLKFHETYQPSFCDLDFCCYGEIWKKPTRLMYNHIDISSLSLRCQGSFHRCSNTKRPHLALTGRDAAGVFWTLRAQPYPHLLAASFASLASGALHGSG